MHYGICAPEKWAPTRESPPLRLNIRFSFASVYLLSCLISLSLIHLLPILINYICRTVLSDGFRIILRGKLHLKSWFQVKNFWPAALSSKESLTYDEVNSWCSDALKLSCRQRDLNVSGSHQPVCSCVCSLGNWWEFCWRKDRNHCRQNSRAAQANLCHALERI